MCHLDHIQTHISLQTVLFSCCRIRELETQDRSALYHKVGPRTVMTKISPALLIVQYAPLRLSEWPCLHLDNPTPIIVAVPPSGCIDGSGPVRREWRNYKSPARECRRVLLIVYVADVMVQSFPSSASAWPFEKLFYRVRVFAVVDMPRDDPFVLFVLEVKVTRSWLGRWAAWQCRRAARTRASTLLHRDRPAVSVAVIPCRIPWACVAAKGLPTGGAGTWIVLARRDPRGGEESFTWIPATISISTGSRSNLEIVACTLAQINPGSHSFGRRRT